MILVSDPCNDHSGYWYSINNIRTLNGPVCKNGGGCVFQNVYPYYHCKCQPGFFGYDCEQTVGFCAFVLFFYSYKTIKIIKYPITFSYISFAAVIKKI